jgi:hypothetical protein
MKKTNDGRESSQNYFDYAKSITAGELRTLELEDE